MSPTEIYRHADGGLYRIVEPCEVKLDNGTWVTGVSYRSIDGGTLYVTDDDRWAERFTLVENRDCHYEPLSELDPARVWQNRSMMEDLTLAQYITRRIMPVSEPVARNAAADEVRHILGRELTRMWCDIVSFHNKFGLEYNGPPRDLPDDLSAFRSKFLQEELDEYNEARLAIQTGGPDLGHRELMLDALVDLVYVALGTAYLHGFNFAEAWRRVQLANMSKVRAKSDGSDSKRGFGGDVVKPAGWLPPSHSDLVGTLPAPEGKPQHELF